MNETTSSKTTITTSQGTLSGRVADGIRRYLGIPYGEPPFGDRRFAEPEAAGGWEGVRDAGAHGPTAPQAPYPGAIGELLSTAAIAGEDILTLNIWAPEAVRRGGAPVAVWLHGGAFERGTAALPAYDGAAFARDGVVFVSVNYRLGTEGFSVLDDAPRNLGLQDVALALQWVHREITAFGGDPGRITIMGESAGGSLVAALLARDDMSPLVAGAIIQSGPLVADSPRRAGRVTAQLAKRLGVATTRAGFGAVPPGDVLVARRDLAAGSTPLRGAPGYSLAVDERSLPRSPHDALAQVDVPVLIGTNTDEYRLWFPPAALTRIGRIQLGIARFALGISRRAMAAYRAAWPGATTGELFGQLATDVLLRAPAVRAARSRRAPTYVYEFAWSSPLRDLRAAHAMEIGFMFDHLGTPDAERMTGAHAPQQLADRMHADWVSFISTGDPGWARFGDGEKVHRYDVEPAVVPLPRAEALDALPAPRIR